MGQDKVKPVGVPNFGVPNFGEVKPVGVPNFRWVSPTSIAWAV